MAIDSEDKRASAGSMNAMEIMPRGGDGTIDQGDRQQVAGFYRGVLAAPLSWTTIGDVFHYDAAQYGSHMSFYFEAFVRATTGTAYARVYDTTLSNPISASQVNTDSASFTRLRNSVIVLTDGSDYRAQFGKLAGDAGEALGAKVIVLS